MTITENKVIGTCHGCGTRLVLSKNMKGCGSGPYACGVCGVDVTADIFKTAQEEPKKYVIDSDLIIDKKY